MSDPAPPVATELAALRNASRLVQEEFQSAVDLLNESGNACGHGPGSGCLDDLPGLISTLVERIAVVSVEVTLASVKGAMHATGIAEHRQAALDMLLPLVDPFDPICLDDEIEAEEAVSTMWATTPGWAKTTP
jgi:hypothetical protein